MSTAIRARWLFVCAGVLSYGAVFGAFVLFESPGLGIGHFFYVPIVLVALGLGFRSGIAAGVFALGLYVAAAALTPRVPSMDVVTTGAVIRGVTYVAMGALVGWFAGDHRQLVRELRLLVENDHLTGIANTRGFDAALEERIRGEEVFALLLGDMDELKLINDRLGHAGGNEALQRLAQTLRLQVRPGDHISRIGGDEFAVLAAVETREEAAALARRLEELAREVEAPTTFGWAVYPREGTGATQLYRAADERLYARKLARRAPRVSDLRSLA